MTEPATQQKPVRVLTETLAFAVCPACRQSIDATVEVEVRLGPLAIEDTPTHENDWTVSPTVDTTTNLRRVIVDHDCRNGHQPSDQQEA